jgi:hypothetical protein
MFISRSRIHFQVSLPHLNIYIYIYLFNFISNLSTINIFSAMSLHWDSICRGTHSSVETKFELHAFWRDGREHVKKQIIIWSVFSSFRLWLAALKNCFAYKWYLQERNCIYIYNGQNWHSDVVNFIMVGDRIGRECVNKIRIKEDCQYILLM